MRILLFYRLLGVGPTVNVIMLEELAAEEAAAERALGAIEKKFTESKHAYFDRIAKYEGILSVAKEFPNTAAGHYAVGRWYSEGFQYDPEISLSELSKALQIEPHHIDALCALGHVHFYLGDEATAALFFTKTLAINPKHTRALFYFSQVELCLENMDAAARLQKDLQSAVDNYDYMNPFQAGMIL